MAIIVVDGVRYEAKEDENVLQAVLSKSLDLPYFCWHPAMGSVGACRQCAVMEYADEGDERGRLQMACMTQVRDGLRISINHPKAVDFRRTVIEWLMVNHPHDCPVCEEGGECHLQDMTVMTGHSVRRFEESKRTWRNQDLGPFIGHEMNRCITCYRCVRFYRDYAGGTDLDAFGSRGRMYFGRVSDGTLANEFSGNLVEVCPTGVFTDKPFSKQYARKWDLQSAPSICPGCSVGCNTFPSERYGQLKRVHNRYHGAVNRYFLCDRGRFGSYFVNSERRIRHAGIKVEDGAFEIRGADAAVQTASEMIGSGVIGIGSPRASFEANYALKLFVGEDRFCTGLSDSEQAVLTAALSVYKATDARVPTLTEVEEADAVLILGEDVANSAPRLSLSIRQAVRSISFEMAKKAAIPLWQDAGVRGHAQHNKRPLFLATTGSTRIDELATDLFSGTTAEIVKMGSKVAQSISSDLPVREGTNFVSQTASALKSANRPLIVTGTTALSPDLIYVAAEIAQSLKTNGSDPGLVIVAREANSFGSAILSGSLSFSEALAAMKGGTNAVVLENDLYTRASEELVNDALEASRTVALDVVETNTMENSAIVFPAASYVESTGTYVNYETRAQRFYQVFEPEDEIRPSWKWISSLAESIGRMDCCWNSIDDLVVDASAFTHLELDLAAPTSEYRVQEIARIPRQPHRYSGRTAMDAHINIHESKALVDDETPFSYSMEGENPGDQAGAVIPYVWSPGWNSNQSAFKFQQEVGGPLHGGDPGYRLLTIGSEDASNLPSPSKAGQESRNGRFEVVNIYPIFGGEELSNRSWPIIERMPAPFVAMNPADAERLGTEEGGGVSSEDLSQSMEVILDDRMPLGTIGLAVGLPEQLTAPDQPIELVADPEFIRKSAGCRNVIAKS